MQRGFSIALLAVPLLTLSSCCCLCRGNHSIRRFWVDYNTWRAPAISMEQMDHLPYREAQVGYYRWMYDKDPGHQLARLGPVPNRQCAPADPSCVPPGDQPFEYEVLYPSVIPRDTEHLWGTKLPEPISGRSGPPTEFSSLSQSAHDPRRSGPEMIPILPANPAGDGKPPIGGGTSAPDASQPSTGNGKPGSRSDSSAPPAPKPAASNGRRSGSRTPNERPANLGPVNPLSRPRPVEEDLPPVLGPSSGAADGVDLTGKSSPSNGAANSHSAFPR